MGKKRDLLDIIAAYNTSQLVKIRHVHSKSGRLVLYLEHYHNRSREKLFLGAFLTMDPNQRARDEQMLRYVLSIRDSKEKEILVGNSMQSSKKVLGFMEYAKQAVASKKPKNRSGYYDAINSFSRVFPSMSISDISPEKAKRYYEHIGQLKPSSINHYIIALRHICSLAMKDGYLSVNPFVGIKCLKAHQEREFLTISELKKLEKTECGNEEVKRAFIWSCYTGMRYGDVLKLTYQQIKEGVLTFQQSKTGSFERMKLPQKALEIAQDGKGLIFALPTYKNMRKHLKNWVANAGIEKHITFHSSRHTFATTLITLNIDVYVVSKLLGHSSVVTTMIYAKLVDQKKDEAMNALNTLNELDN